MHRLLSHHTSKTKKQIKNDVFRFSEGLKAILRRFSRGPQPQTSLAFSCNDAILIKLTLDGNFAVLRKFRSFRKKWPNMLLNQLLLHIKLIQQSVI